MPPARCGACKRKSRFLGQPHGVLYRFVKRKPSGLYRPEGLLFAGERRLWFPMQGPILYRPGSHPGRIWNPPLHGFFAPETCEFPGWCGTYRTTVGRDALIPPDPCAAANTRGRAMALPCEPESILRPNGKRQPHDTTYLCRGRCLHRPAGPCAAAIPRFARNIKFIRKNETNPSRLQPTARRKSPGLCTGRGIWLFCPVSGYSAASSCAASSPRICSSRIFLMFSSMWKLLSSGIYRISSVMLTGSQKLVTTSTSGESG